MNRSLSILILLTLVIASVSCKKKIPNYEEDITCLKALPAADSLKVAQQLPGTWVWRAKSCFHNAQDQLADKELMVTFSWDGSTGKYMLSSPTDEIDESQTGSFFLQKLPSNEWFLTTSPSSYYLDGYVKFCSNKLLFMNIDSQGCDYMFESQ